MVKLQRSDDLRLAEHPSACTPETFAEWCQQRRDAGERLAVDLFSGAGGLSLGLEAAGWTVAVAVDNDPKALQTHRHNFPGLALSHDLAEPAGRQTLVDLLSQTEIDLVAGGPPCQPFSRAGSSKIRSLVRAATGNDRPIGWPWSRTPAAPARPRSG
jgi:DNA (cytosine-5)-methyltransferase 1